jgi:hypothetical protein
VFFPCLRLAEDRDPHPIRVDDRGHSDEQLHVNLPGHWLDVVPPHIQGTQSHTPLTRRTSARPDVTDALREAAPDQHIAIRIHPQAQVFLHTGTADIPA